MDDLGLHARVAPYALAAVALGAAVTSFDALLRLAEHAGWGSPFPAVFLPITLDALAVGAWSVWSSTKSTYARTVGIIAVAASILGNVASHAYDRGAAEPNFATVALVAAVAPLAVILVWLMPREAAPEAPPVKPRPTRHRAAVATSAPRPTTVTATVPPAAGDREAAIAAAIAAATVSGRASVRGIREATGCSESVAREAARRIAEKKEVSA